jgi:hypothetical protein
LKSYETLIELPERAPDALVADEGYDPDAIRDDLKQRGICAVILPKSTTSGFTVSATPQACHPCKHYRGAAAVDLTPDPNRSARARRNLLCVGLFLKKRSPLR